MNRLLLALNAVLALVLTVQVFGGVFGGSSAHASAGEDRLVTADQLRVLTLDPARGRSRFVVDLGADVGPLDVDGAAPIEADLRLDPETPFLAHWISPRAFEVIPSKALPAGRRITLHFAEALAAEGGRVEAGAAVSFETPGLRKLQVVLEGEDPAAPTLLVGVDCPVIDDELLAALELRADGEVVPFEGENAQFALEQAFRIRPQLPKGRRVERLEVVVRPGLVPRGGDVELAREVRSEVRLWTPLIVQEVSATEGRVQVLLSHAVPLPEADQIRVEPEVPFELVRKRGGFSLVGDFPPGRPVTVELVEGFPGRGATRLEQKVRLSVLVPDREPRIELDGEGHVLSTLARPELSVTGVNVEEYTVTLQRIYANNVVPFLDPYVRSSYHGAPEVTIKRSLLGARNEEATDVLDLEALLGEAPRGIYRVRCVGSADRRRVSDSELLQITDLAVTARVVGEQLAVQATSLAHGNAAAGADVTVWTRTNQVLARGQLDERGIATIRWQEGAGREPFAVQVQQGEDVAVIDLRSFGVELASPALGGRGFVAGDELEAFVHFPRGIARPGETLAATAIVRDGAGVAPSGRKLELRWFAPDRRLWRSEQHTLHGSGLLTAELATDGETPSGRWRFAVVDVARGERTIGSGSIQVRPFVPDRLEAEVRLDDTFRLGSSVPVTVRGRWLDGTPAVGQSARLRVRFDHSPWRSSAGEAAGEPWADWSFSRLSSRGGAQPAPPGALSTVAGVLDAEGSVVFQVPVPAEAWSPCLAVTIEAEVIDPSGRAVRARGRSTAWRSDFHLGMLRVDGGVEVAAVDADGGAVAIEADATVQVERRTWEVERVRRGLRGWRYRTEVAAELLHELPVDLASGRVQVALADEEPLDGWLVAIVQCAGQRAEVPLGDVPMRPDRLRVALDGEVRPGGAATLTVESPVAGRGFVTVEGVGLHAVEVVALRAGSTQVKVPVPADVQTPNVHCVVTLSRPQAVRDASGPFWLVGACDVPLQRDDRHLPVTVTATSAADGAQLPEQPLQLVVEAPGALRATVAVVDRGVLNRTRHRLRDPADWFLASRGASGRGADSGTRLWSRVAFDPGVITGGDGGDDGGAGLMLRGSVDTRVRPLALLHEVVLDADGRGKLEIPMQQYEGRVQVAVIASGARRCGSTALELPVRAPLGVQLAAPRVARPGDRVWLPVTLTNRTEKADVARFDVLPSGGLVLAIAAPPAVQLAAGEVRTVEIPVVLNEGAPEGRAGIEVRARLGDESRVVRIDFPVSPAAPWQRESRGIVTDGSWSMQVPDDYEGEVTVRVRIDDRPDVALRPGLEAMLAYPYGCLEQTCSKGQALLSCQALLPALYGEDGTAPNVDELVRAAVQRVLSMQRREGGFGWWAGSRPWSFGDVLAADFLLRAREQGAFVPGDAIDRVVDRVERVLRSERHGTPLRAQAAYLVARAGRPVQPWLDLLVTRAEDLQDRARLAWCLARAGQQQRALDLLASGAGTDPSASPGLLGSPLRSRAYLLRAGFAAAPDGPRWPTLAAELTRAVARPGALTTQERAAVLRTLAEYYAGQGERRRMVRGTLTAVGRELSIERGEWQELTARAGDALTLAVDGRAFGVVELVGRRRPPAETEASGVTVTRRLVDEETGEEVTEVQRGRVYRVLMMVRAKQGAEHLALMDQLPGGLEGEPENGPAWREGFELGGLPVVKPDALELRDDRVVWLQSAAVPRAFVATYRVRATLQGSWQWPALHAEGMYDPELRQRGGEVMQIEVKP